VLRDAAAEHNERVARLEMRVREREDQLRERAERIGRLEQRVQERDAQLHELNDVEAEARGRVCVRVVACADRARCSSRRS
jgi:chromosome segregation ATPase